MDTGASRVSRVRRGAVLLRVDGALFYLPASVALRITLAPRVTPVPGAPPELVGVALHQGVVVPVVSIGPSRTEMVLCQHAGELMGLLGGEVVRTGSFQVPADRADAVLHEGQRARPLDVSAIYARVQSGSRPGRWGV
jgi:hypothetical protein